LWSVPEILSEHSLRAIEREGEREKEREREMWRDGGERQGEREREGERWRRERERWRRETGRVKASLAVVILGSLDGDGVCAEANAPEVRVDCCVVSMCHDHVLLRRVCVRERE